MCSIQEGDVLTPERQTALTLDGRKCMKCSNEEVVVIIRINDAFCKDCFLAYCTHKFRSAFGKSRLIRDKEHVLVAHSGGKGSSAMVHLIQEGTSKRAHKKLRFASSVVYVDDGAFFGLSRAERAAENKKVTQHLAQSGLDVYIYAIEQVMSIGKPGPASPPGLTPQPLSDEALNQILALDSELDRLGSLMDSCASDTARQCMIHILRQRLLSEVARGLGVNKVLLGDSMTTLAVQLLSNITQGRGAHLLFDMGFADHRLSDVTFVRPMREFTSHEIETYLIQTNTRTLDPISHKPKGLEGLTSDFVLGLQADFPNTVSTIMRTGDKLDAASLSSEEVDRDMLCCFCQAPLDTNVGPCSALSATEFSQIVSNMKTQSSGEDQRERSSNETTCCGQGDGSCASSIRSDLPDLKPMLCYGCRVLTRDLKSPSTLPPVILKDAVSRKSRSQMREAIQDFLLDDEAVGS